MSTSVLLTPRDVLTNTGNEALDRIAKYGPYGYAPNLGGAIFFCIVYGISAVILCGMAIRYRRWWMLATLGFGAALECAGNAIRIGGHFSPDNVNAYIAQQVILVLTPAFFAAAHFTILSKLGELFGDQYIKPVRSSWMIPFFVVLDVASLAVQGGGSGQAATAEINGDQPSTINNYGYIVSGGLGIQLAGYLAFNIVFFLFVYRTNADPPSQHTERASAQYWNGRMKIFLAAVWCSALLVLLRSVFRTVEMSLGWIGTVATTEWFYLVFDATFVTLAILIFVAVPPPLYMPREVRQIGKQSAAEAGAGSEKRAGSDMEAAAASSAAPASSERQDYSMASSITEHGGQQEPKADLKA